MIHTKIIYMYITDDNQLHTTVQECLLPLTEYTNQETSYSEKSLYMYPIQVKPVKWSRACIPFRVISSFPKQQQKRNKRNINIRGFRHPIVQGLILAESMRQLLNLQIYITVLQLLRQKCIKFTKFKHCNQTNL